MRLTVSWLSNVVAIYVAALVFDGISFGGKAWVLLVAGLVFALVNLVVRPLVVLLTLPAVLLTLGLALFFVNALMFWLTSLIVPPFEVGGFWTVLGGAVLIWAMNALLAAGVRSERRAWRVTA